MTAALSGIEEMLEIAGVSQMISVGNLGVWRASDYRDGSRLREYRSIDWYLARGRQTGRRGQLNASTITFDLMEEPWRRQEHHYDVILLESDIYNGGNTNFVLGVGTQASSAIISRHRLSRRYLPELPEDELIECYKTAVMHEVGHMLGLPGRFGTRGHLEESLGMHCTNTCLMRQRLRLEGWEELTADRLRRGSLCIECRREIVNFFQDMLPDGHFEPMESSEASFRPVGDDQFIPIGRR
ncbi:hypothetical protein EPN90_04535 [Patescibacteria group bacterium]|nr:MAG: hypothetical protein EPN90_04535 [Patescibacteria group bacterium]